MKALASAEKDKKDLQGEHRNHDATTELSALESSTTPLEVTDTFKQEQRAAANIFNAAEQSNKPYFSYAIIGLLSLVGLFILWFGFQILKLNTNESEVLLAQNRPHIAAIPPHPQTFNSVISHQLEAIVDAPLPAKLAPNKPLEPVAQTQQPKVPKMSKQAKTATPSSHRPPASNLTKHNIAQDSSHPIQLSNTANAHIKRDTAIATHATTPHFEQTHNIQMREAPSMRVDTPLLQAYNAYIAGQDANAKKLYRSVLETDVRQVDALLGMAAIAQRQARDNDAVGWYQKVLEIEPLNATALTGIVSAYPNADPISQVNRLQQLIAKQPNTASFHAALGNIYAEQNAWSKAQAAYFNASRYAQHNADYAFNLAISLEHLSKPMLAATHYQRSLDLVTHSGAASPARTLIQSRLDALR